MMGMNNALLAAAGALMAVSASTMIGAAQGRPTAAARAAVAAVSAPDAVFLKQYCLGCHNERTRIANLALDALDSAKVDGDVDVWEKVVRKLRTGMMPPEGAPKPPDAVRATFVSALEGRLDRVALAHPDPGSPALHRLNRAEYANAIRDLLSVDVDVSAMLPPDDSAAGFDNNADVLGVSPALIESYASAAAKISRIAVGDPGIGLDRVTYRVPGDLEQDVHIDGLPLGTRGGIVVRHTFPLDAEYDLEIGSGGPAPLGGPRGGGAPAVDDRYVSLDEERVALQPRGATRIRVTAGAHTVAGAAGGPRLACEPRPICHPAIGQPQRCPPTPPLAKRSCCGGRPDRMPRCRRDTFSPSQS
jgi:hypothetical protein